MRSHDGGPPSPGGGGGGLGRQVGVHRTDLVCTANGAGNVHIRNYEMVPGANQQRKYLPYRTMMFPALLGVLSKLSHVSIKGPNLCTTSTHTHMLKHGTHTTHTYTQHTCTAHIHCTHTQHTYTAHCTTIPLTHTQHTYTCTHTQHTYTAHCTTHTYTAHIHMHTHSTHTHAHIHMHTS